MKNEFVLSLGSEVLFQNQPHIIKSHESLTSFCLINKNTKEEIVAELDALSPVDESSQTKLSENGLIHLDDDAWKEAERRMTLIKPLAEMNRIPGAIIAEVSTTLDLSKQMLYKLIKRFRDSGELLTSLAPRRSSGGRGKSRLSVAVEQIITSTITELYLSKQKRTAENITYEIRRQCMRAKLTPPTTNTVRQRIRALCAKEAILRREGYDAARKLSAVKGSFPTVDLPLDVIQMDHTPVDLIVVDEITRRPIGRPYLTAAIDVFSRCITGFCLTLEAPSATSVGLCLTHSVMDKTAYLTNFDITGEWPIWGKPRMMYVDNGADFHSEALRRGCQLHGIELKYRPPGEPQYGGIIERLIGTLMQHVHTLPGTTFSNIAQRGEYHSDNQAILTLSELEKWLTWVIVGHYHNKVHASLYEPPLERYKSGMLAGGPKPMIYNKKAFLIDFLPIVKRSIQRHGFMIDHINYYSHTLQPWIAERKSGESFVIRRDPRDISRVYVLPPQSDEYIEVPYRRLSHPAVTLWEQKESLKYLKAQGVGKVDEHAIFTSIEAMRKITDSAAASKRSARRNKTRTQHVMQAPIDKDRVDEASITSSDIKLFDNIEAWS